MINPFELAARINETSELTPYVFYGSIGEATVESNTVIATETAEIRRQSLLDDEMLVETAVSDPEKFVPLCESAISSFLEKVVAFFKKLADLAVGLARKVGEKIAAAKDKIVEFFRTRHAAAQARKAGGGNGAPPKPVGNPADNKNGTNNNQQSAPQNTQQNAAPQKPQQQNTQNQNNGNNNNNQQKNQNQNQKQNTNNNNNNQAQQQAKPLSPNINMHAWHIDFVLTDLPNATEDLTESWKTAMAYWDKNAGSLPGGVNPMDLTVGRATIDAAAGSQDETKATAAIDKFNQDAKQFTGARQDELEKIWGNIVKGAKLNIRTQGNTYDENEVINTIIQYCAASHNKMTYNVHDIDNYVGGCGAVLNSQIPRALDRIKKSYDDQVKMLNDYKNTVDSSQRKIGNTLNIQNIRQDVASAANAYVKAVYQYAMDITSGYKKAIDKLHSINLQQINSMCSDFQAAVLLLEKLNAGKK